MSTAHHLEQGEYLTPAAAARALGVSVRTLKRYIAAGRIAPHHYTDGGHGRFLAEDVLTLCGERDQPRHLKARA